MTWQFLGYAVSFGSLAVGVTITAVYVVTAFLEWLYPDRPEPEEQAVIDAITGAERDYLAEVSRRTFRDTDIAKFGPSHGALVAPKGRRDHV